LAQDLKLACCPVTSTLSLVVGQCSMVVNLLSLTLLGLFGTVVVAEHQLSHHTADSTGSHSSCLQDNTLPWCKDVYNCLTRGGWSKRKRKWCCADQGRGCPSQQHDCASKETWTCEKRKWCCNQEHRGCPANNRKIRCRPPSPPSPPTPPSPVSRRRKACICGKTTQRLVCGVNGKTYANACLARCAGVRVQHQGRCRGRGFKCRPKKHNCYTKEVWSPGKKVWCRKWLRHCRSEPRRRRRPCVCSREYRPVCGVNGNTYGNACMARCANIRVKFKGKCSSVSSGNSPSKPSSSSTRRAKPVKFQCHPKKYNCYTKEVWSTGKKKWCHQWLRRCGKDDKQPPFVGGSGNSGPSRPGSFKCRPRKYNCRTKEVWSSSKKAYCYRWLRKCRGSGPPSSTPTSPASRRRSRPAKFKCLPKKYNCYTKEVWSSGKKKWCRKWVRSCRNTDIDAPFLKGKGDSAGSPPKFKCHPEKFNCHTRERWSPAKKVWCKTWFRKCRPKSNNFGSRRRSSTSTKFKCRPKKHNCYTRERWSPGKRDWCKQWLRKCVRHLHRRRRTAPGSSKMIGAR